jgi:hypothetical protein
MHFFPRSLTISETANELMLSVHKEYSINVEKRSLPFPLLDTNMSHSAADTMVDTAPFMAKGGKYVNVKNSTPLFAALPWPTERACSTKENNNAIRNS